MLPLQKPPTRKELKTAETLMSMHQGVPAIDNSANIPPLSLRAHVLHWMLMQWIN